MTGFYGGSTTTSVQHGKILIYCGSDVIFELLLKTYNYMVFFLGFESDWKSTQNKVTRQFFLTEGAPDPLLF
jgi:hypothetical protein